MRKIITNLFIMLAVMTLILTPVVWSMNSANADENCTIQVGAGGVGILVCGGTPVDQLPLPTVKITVPGPTVTDIIKIPGPMVTVPGPVVTQAGPTVYATQTVTATAQGPTATQTIPGPTSTITNKATVTASPTATPVETVTGNTTSDDGGIIPDGNLPGLSQDAVKAGIGILSLIILIASLLISMYVGYALGYKDSERDSANFYRALSDHLRTKKK